MFCLKEALNGQAESNKGLLKSIYIETFFPKVPLLEKKVWI